MLDHADILQPLALRTLVDCLGVLASKLALHRFEKQMRLTDDILPYIPVGLLVMLKQK